MPEHPRIEDLRRRVQKDPASIAFAQLAEELRRAGSFDEAVAVCHAGLAIHPGYLSARVTLGRALIELEQFGDAQSELEVVLKSAPENLAAIRGLADIHHRRDELAQALKYYQTALSIARHDPDLEETVASLTRALSKEGGPRRTEGLSFEQTTQLLNVPAPPVRTPVGSAAAAPAGIVLPAAAERERAERTIAALEHWLDAIHVTRAERRA